MKLQLEYCVQFWTSFYKEVAGKLEQVCLENNHQNDLATQAQCTISSFAEIFSLHMHSGSSRSNVHTLHYEKYLIRYKENTRHSECNQGLEQAAWRGCVTCILGGIQNLMGQAFSEQI